MITFANTLTFTSGGVLGILIGYFIEHQLARSRSIEAIRITEFNKGAAVFRAAFVDTVFLLRRHKEGASGLIRKIISDTVLVDQEKAKILFEPFLDKTVLGDFGMAWDAYVNSRINYGSINANPTKAEESQFCLDHIDKLLYYAKPKIS